MSVRKLCVLGGSSPFTAGLIDAFVDSANELPAFQLTIHGRNVERTGLVSEYANDQLASFGWIAAPVTSLPEALDGADIVIHQIRYGDLQGRAAGEKVCQQVGLPPDETLGPAALLSAIQTLPALQNTCEALADYCPDAQVLNLTNPLSSITAAMIQFGVKNCVGLCELPLVTMQAAAKILDIQPSEISWSYCGLNHRGFIDQMSSNGEDLISKLPGKMNGEQLGGIESTEIEQLDAIPLKYFRLTRELPELEFGRAEYLVQLRNKIADELSESTTRSPTSMNERYMDWYPKSVVPLVGALCEDAPTSHVVNTRRHDGLVIETLAQVSCDRIAPDFHESKNQSVKRWNAIFEEHERRFNAAMFDPTVLNLRQVFESDPIVPDEKVVLVVEALKKQLTSPVTL